MERATPESPLINMAVTGLVLTSIAFTEEQVRGQKFLRYFAAACRKMSPLVEFIETEILREEGAAHAALRPSLCLCCFVCSTPLVSQSWVSRVTSYAEQTH